MEYKETSWSMQINKIAQYLFIFFAFCIPISLALENTGFALTLLFALLSGLWWRYRRAILVNPFSLWLLLLFLLFIVGLVYSEASIAWRFTVLKKEGEIIAILFLLPVISFDQSFLLKVIKSYVIGCILVMLIAWLGQFHLLPGMKWFQHPAPYYTFFKIYSALFMAFGAYLTLILSKISWLKPVKWFWLLVFILISYNVLWQSLSRTGYLIYFGLMLVFFLQHFSKRGKLVSIILLLIAVSAVLLFSKNMRTGLWRVINNGKVAATQQKNLNTSTGVRYEYLRNSLQLWQQKPIFGYGTGGFRAADIKIKGTTSNGNITTIAHAQVTPENTYYRILVEQGVVGLIILILLWGWQLMVAFKMTEPLVRNLAVAFMLVMIFASFSQDLLLDESPRLFYILFSVLLYAPVIMRKQ